MSICVLGSINMDLVARAPHLPAPGETLTGHSFTTVPGGKGANQAVACARLGTHTRLVGRVGGDGFGDALLRSLQDYGVDTTHVTVDDAVSSGVALITVDDQAQNTIIVIPGANGRIGVPDLARLDQAFRDTSTSYLLLQLEVPLDAVVAAAGLARELGVGVILDPAPAAPLPADLYTLVDILTPNESEAAALVGFPVHEVDAAEAAAEVLLQRGTRRVVIKMGALGAYAATTEGGKFYPALPVTAVDTVAAGDAFNGALAVALAGGQSFEEALIWALAGGACAVTVAGAQPSMPDRDALLALLARAEGWEG